MDDEAVAGAVGAAGDDEVDGRVPRAARGAEQLSRRISADHATSGYEQRGRAGAEREVHLDVRADVDIGEEPTEPWPAQCALGDQTGGTGSRASERVVGVERHAVPGGSRVGAVP